MRLALAAVLVLGLAGCAPDAGAAHQYVPVFGVVTQVTASGGERSYMLDASPSGFLPIDVGDLEIPAISSGVVVEVPKSLPMPEDQPGVYEALNGYVEKTGDPLVVIGFVP